MPTTRFAPALLSLYFSETNNRSPPWDFPRWQEITGIKHGLFPDEDALLPLGWDRSTVIEVQSFFEQYSKIVGEDKRNRYARNTKGQQVHPGRDKWLAFCNGLWKRAKLHNIIVDALRAGGYHPVDILMNLPQDPGQMPSFPNYGDYISSLADIVAFALFGDDAMNQNIGNTGTGVVQHHIRTRLSGFIIRSWDALRMMHVSTVKKLPSFETEAEGTLKALSEEPTSRNMRLAMKSVNKFLLRAQVSGITAMIEKAGQLRADIEDVFDGMGKNVRTRDEQTESRPQGKGLCKLTKDNLQKLASDEDVEGLLRLYDALFTENEDSAYGQLHSEVIDETVQQCITNVDLGVEQESTMDIGALSFALGYSNGLPFLFNCSRHKAGYNPWENPGAFDSKSPDFSLENIMPTSLHWHQLAGVHSIFRNVFSSNPSDGESSCHGMLIADEVGLGKTAMAITVLANLSHLVWLQENKNPLPPLFQKYPYLGNSKAIPSHPHLIVVPPTLMKQWEIEIKTFVQPHKVDILLYHANQKARSQFWDSDGPFQKSKHRKHQIIIIASEPAVTQDFLKAYYAKVDTRSKEPWALPRQKRDGNFNNTLFAQEYLTITFDEAHRYKNIGTRFYAGLRLRKQARITLACTATPLQTGPKDIPNLGRLIGIPHFFTPDYLLEEKEDSALIRRAKRDEDPNVLIKEQTQIVTRLQKDFKGHLLRRTTKSKNSEGGQLLNLPPLVEIVGILKLTEEEREIIEQLSEETKDAVCDSNGQGKRSLTERFFLNHRTSILSLTLEDNPELKDLAEWESKKSTKLDAFVNICKHYLSRDDAPHIYFEDGKLVVPDNPAEDEMISQKRRICAYVEFTQFYPLIKRVLDLHNIPFLWLDGRVPWEKRNTVVQKLYTDGNPRLLIFSSVGSTGVNMAIADVMIHIDVCWSDQDMRQINGRIHRQPQDKTVHVIHLLADDTSDVVMYAMAKGKKAMLEAFVNRNPNIHYLHDLLSGQVLTSSDETPEGEIEDEGKETRGSKRRRSVKKSTARKNKDTDTVKASKKVEESHLLNTEARDNPVKGRADADKRIDEEGKLHDASGAELEYVSRTTVPTENIPPGSRDDICESGSITQDDIPMEVDDLQAGDISIMGDPVLDLVDVSDSGLLTPSHVPPSSESEFDHGFSDSDRDVSVEPFQLSSIKRSAPRRPSAPEEDNIGGLVDYPSSLVGGKNSPLTLTQSDGDSPKPKRHKPSTPAPIIESTKDTARSSKPFAPRSGKSMDIVIHRTEPFHRKTDVVDLGDNDDYMIDLDDDETPIPEWLKLKRRKLSTAFMHLGTTNPAIGTNTSLPTISPTPVVEHRTSRSGIEGIVDSHDRDATAKSNKGKNKRVGRIIPPIELSVGSEHSYSSAGTSSQRSSASVVLPSNRVPAHSIPGTRLSTPLPPANATKARARIPRPSQP